MTQHADLIERLRRQSAELADTGRTLDYSAGVAAANALEAAAKNAFEAMPHDIPQRMKDAICEETGWSGSMVSRMYTELRKAFTGEPYKANEDLDAALLEVERLRKDAERLDFVEAAPGGSVRMDANSLCPSYIYWGKSDYYKEARRNDAGNFCGPTLRAVLDAAMKEKGQP